MSALRFVTVLLAVLSAGVALLAVPALGSARTVSVMVVDNAYDDGYADPRTTHITAGDTVEWRWADDNQNRHTVTSEGDDFDSDRECDDDKAPCRSPGHRYEITFDEPGEYVYYCKVHDPDDPLTVGDGMQARVVVEEREPSPSPSPSGDRSPSEQDSEPGQEQSPGGDSSPSPSPDDTATGGEDAEDADNADDPDDAADAGSRRVSPPRSTSRAPTRSRETFAPAPSPSNGELRAVEVASPSFSPFPSPSPLPTVDEVDDLTVEVPGRGPGSPSPALVGVAIGALALSGGVLAKVVLFGSPW